MTTRTGSFETGETCMNTSDPERRVNGLGPRHDDDEFGFGLRRHLLTVGHGTLSREEFADLLTAAGVERVVDVRSAPGSRRNPQFQGGRLLIKHLHSHSYRCQYSRYA